VDHFDPRSHPHLHLSFAIKQRIAPAKQIDWTAAYGSSGSCALHSSACLQARNGQARPASISVLRKGGSKLAKII